MQPSTTSTQTPPLAPAPLAPLNDPQVAENTLAETEYITWLYWAKSYWNGAACVPVVFISSTTEIRMIDNKSEVFRVPINTVAAHAGAFSIIKLRANGKQYRLTGTATAISPRLSAEQQNLLGRDLTAPRNLTQTGVMGAALSATGTLVGGNAVALGADMASVVIGTSQIKLLMEQFQSLGVETSGKSPHTLRNTLNGVLLAPLILFTLVGVGEILSHSHSDNTGGAVSLVVILIILILTDLLILFFVSRKDHTYNRNTSGNNS